MRILSCIKQVSTILLFIVAEIKFHAKTYKNHISDINLFFHLNKTVWYKEQNIMLSNLCSTFIHNKNVFIYIVWGLSSNTFPLFFFFFLAIVRITEINNNKKNWTYSILPFYLHCIWYLFASGKKLHFS